jgi:hypothetical protein
MPHETINQPGAFTGSDLFTSQTKSPGRIDKNDALGASDIAQLVNEKSNTKFPKADVPQMPDTQQPGLSDAPGELIGRGENKIRRPSAYGDDSVKAAGMFFKKALYDVNVDTINTTNRAPSLARPKSIPDGLDKEIIKAPRLGDYKANPPVGDTRDYDGSAPTREAGGVKARDVEQNPISNKYELDGGLKVATPIPDVMMSEEDWHQPNGDDDFEDGEHLSRKVDNTGNLAHVGVGKGIPGSRGTFVSHFMRKLYEKQ